MPRCKTNGIEIEYESFGDEGDRPLLAIMGLGAQMIFWEEEFITLLANRGHRVIRFDNRDVGLSTKFEAAGVPDIASLLGGQATPGAAPYTLDDMADDTAGLLDALRIDSAHAVGASMGGMIAQTLAVRHPRRVRTLVSIMSSTGNPTLPPATPEAMAVLMRPPATSREEAIQRGVDGGRVMSGGGFAFDEQRARDRAAHAFERCFHPEGVARQMAAVIPSGPRNDALAKLDVPTLVIHGDSDPLVPVEAGRDTADAIPGADLLVVPGMGHELPRDAWPAIVDAIANHTAKADPPA